MGPLLLTGMALFGAAVAVGTVATRTSPPPPGPSSARVTPVRRLALILIAFASGCGVSGVVAGILAIELVGAIDATSYTIVAGLAIAGAVIGLLPIVRDAGRLDPWVVSKAVVAIVCLALLGLVVAVLASVIREAVAAAPPAWPFPILGLISAGGSIGLGVVGGRSLPAIAAADEAAGTALMAKAIPRIVPFELAAYASSIVGIVLIVSG
jgi:hypothetical protein